jgi:hypothetical protein
VVSALTPESGGSTHPCGVGVFTLGVGVRAAPVGRPGVRHVFFLRVGEVVGDGVGS